MAHLPSGRRPGPSSEPSELRPRSSHSPQAAKDYLEIAYWFSG